MATLALWHIGREYVVPDRANEIDFAACAAESNFGNQQVRAQRFADGDRSVLLLVDEDPDTLDAYRRYFEYDGMSVAVATRPSDAHQREDAV